MDDADSVRLADERSSIGSGFIPLYAENEGLGIQGTRYRWLFCLPRCRFCSYILPFRYERKRFIDMGKQHNKAQKRVRRKDYLKRKASLSKMQAALEKRSGTRQKAEKAPVAEVEEEAAAAQKAPAKKAPAKKAATKTAAKKTAAKKAPTKKAAAKKAPAKKSTEDDTSTETAPKEEAAEETPVEVTAEASDSESPAKEE